MANGTITVGALTVDPDFRAFTFSLMDVSGDSWAETLYVALTATRTAIQAWMELYQLVTQATIFKVEESFGWGGDADPDNAEAGIRSGVENGINLLFKNPDTRQTRPLRIVAPEPAILQGNQDIPLLSATNLTNLIVATLALQPTYPFVSAQYTSRRERKNNPKVK